MLTNLAFTDPQGNVYTDAVVAVYDLSQSESINRTINTNDLDLPLLQETKQTNITVKFAYWISQAAFDNRQGCYWLGNFAESSEYFNIYSDETQKSKYDGLSAEESAELYFTDEILPLLSN